MELDLTISDSVFACTGDWRKLWLQSPDNPFLHPGWHLAFAEAYPRPLRPRIVHVRRAGKLVGVLPLRQDYDGVLRFLTAPRSDYEDALVAKEGQGATVASLVDFLRHRRFELAQVPASSPLCRALESCGVLPKPASVCPGISLSEHTVKEICARKSLRRDEKLLARRGPLVLETVPRENALAELDVFMDQHIARWLVAGEDSMFLLASNREFYRRLVSREDFLEFGAFHVLRVGGIAASYHLGLHGGSRFVFYKPTFDLNLQAESPGKILMTSLLQRCFDAGLAYFDLSRGDEDYKQRFATEARQNYSFSRGLPRLRPVFTSALRRLSKLRFNTASYLRDIGGRRSIGRAGRLFELPEQSVSPGALPGYDADFRLVDLVRLGALRIRLPHLITTDYMRAAIARRKRGDHLLLVTDQQSRSPVLLAWMRVSGDPMTEFAERQAIGAGQSEAIIYDIWHRQSDSNHLLVVWALRFLAWKATRQEATSRLWCSGSEKGTFEAAKRAFGERLRAVVGREFVA